MELYNVMQLKAIADIENPYFYDNKFYKYY